MLEKKNIFKY